MNITIQLIQPKLKTHLVSISTVTRSNVQQKILFFYDDYFDIAVLKILDFPVENNKIRSFPVYDDIPDDQMVIKLGAKTGRSEMFYQEQVSLVEGRKDQFKMICKKKDFAHGDCGSIVAFTNSESHVIPFCVLNVSLDVVDGILKQDEIYCYGTPFFEVLRKYNFVFDLDKNSEERDKEDAENKDKDSLNIGHGIGIKDETITDPNHDEEDWGDEESANDYSSGDQYYQLYGFVVADYKIFYFK
jgi:hypothetical protein